MFEIYHPSLASKINPLPADVAESHQIRPEIVAYAYDIIIYFFFTRKKKQFERIIVYELKNIKKPTMYPVGCCFFVFFLSSVYYTQYEQVSSDVFEWNNIATGVLSSDSPYDFDTGHCSQIRDALNVILYFAVRVMIFSPYCCRCDDNRNNVPYIPRTDKIKMQKKNVIITK